MHLVRTVPLLETSCLLVPKPAQNIPPNLGSITIPPATNRFSATNVLEKYCHLKLALSLIITEMMQHSLGVVDFDLFPDSSLWGKRVGAIKQVKLRFVPSRSLEGAAQFLHSVSRTAKAWTSLEDYKNTDENRSFPL